MQTNLLQCRMRDTSLQSFLTWVFPPFLSYSFKVDLAPVEFSKAHLEKHNEAEEMACGREHLLYRHGDLCLDLQHPQERRLQS